MCVVTSVCDILLAAFNIAVVCFKGKGLAFFGLPTLYSGWVRLSTGLFYTVVKDPPPFVRQHMKFYVIPSIRKALQNSYFTFNFPLNFVWEDFLVSCCCLFIVYSVYVVLIFHAGISLDGNFLDELFFLFCALFCYEISINKEILQ